MRYYTEYLPARGGFSEKHWTPTDSLEVLAAAAGFDYEILKNSADRMSLKEFYPLVLSLQEPFKEGAFSGWDFDESTLRDRRFLEFLGLLRDLVHAKEKNVSNWQAQRIELGLDGPISLDVLDKAIEKMQHEMAEIINSIFERYSAMREEPFTYKDFKKLMAAWGDIDPVTTLLSRYEGKRVWREEIPILLEVFRQSLDGNFKDYKFNWGNESEDQIEMIPEDLRSKWIDDRFLLSLGENSRGDETSEAEKAVHNLVSSNLKPHSHDLFEFEKHKSTKRQTKVAESLLQEILTANPIEVVKSKELSVEVAKWHLRNVVLLFSKTGAASLDQYRGWARLGWAILTAYPDLVEKEAGLQLRNDFKAIEKVSTVQTSAVAKAGLVFTVLGSDPKFLLTIGDLVDTSSCQNYRTGSVIQTLLGYVIDANVKALASFHLTSPNFETPSQYEEVFLAKKSNSISKIEWNGNTRVVTFRLANRKTVTTKPLGHAFLRQMVKVGSTEGGVGILLEREYMQMHPALAVMRANHQKIYDDLSADLEADNTGTLTIKESRNPGGQYSDAGNGVETDDYEVEL